MTDNIIPLDAHRSVIEKAVKDAPLGGEIGACVEAVRVALLNNGMGFATADRITEAVKRRLASYDFPQAQQTPFTIPIEHASEVAALLDQQRQMATQTIVGLLCAVFAAEAELDQHRSGGGAT